MKKNMFEKIKDMNIDEFTEFFYPWVRDGGSNATDIEDIESHYCNNICEHRFSCSIEEVCPVDKDYKLDITEKERIKEWLLFKE